MWLELAGASGVPPSVLKDAWPEADFRQYAAYRARWPSVEARLDFWFGQTLAAVVNPWRKAGAKPVNPTDLIPDWWGERAERAGPKTVQDWKNLLLGMVKARGGRVVYQKGKAADGQ